MVQSASDTGAIAEEDTLRADVYALLGFLLRSAPTADGLRRVAEDDVLNANYVMAQLKDDMSVSYPAPCMHEVLFDDSFLKDTGVTMLDFAKAMIDEGFHPATVYFPLVVQGALLTEPTESESKESLDRFIGSLRFLARQAKAGDAGRFTDAPRFPPAPTRFWSGAPFRSSMARCRILRVCACRRPSSTEDSDPTRRSGRTRAAKSYFRGESAL